VDITRTDELYCITECIPHLTSFSAFCNFIWSIQADVFYVSLYVAFVFADIWMAIALLKLKSWTWLVLLWLRIFDRSTLHKRSKSILPLFCTFYFGSKIYLGRFKKKRSCLWIWGGPISWIYIAEFKKQSNTENWELLHISPEIKMTQSTRTQNDQQCPRATSDLI